MNKPVGKSVLYCMMRVLGYFTLVYLLLFSIGFGIWDIDKANYRSQDSGQAVNRLIIKFNDNAALKNGTQFQKEQFHLNSISDLNQLYDVSVAGKFNASHGNMSVDEKFRSIYILNASSFADPEQLAAEYSSLPNVAYAEPDYLMELHDIVTDVHYPQQWGLHNVGQWHSYVLRRPGDGNDKLEITYGLHDADIDVGEVYFNPPDKTVTTIVAIIDSGVDTNHPDLASIIWRNPGEDKYNGLDDDNNGYVDDAHGWDFSSSNNVLEIDLEDNDPTDEFGHGTHCAGIVAGIANNGMGIAGVSNTCRIMALKIMPWPVTSKLAQAIIYAADNGADVINMSLGYPYNSFLLEDAVQYAKAKGVVLCASTGNSYIEETNYPAGFDDVIAVGASNDSDLVTDFSTFGDHIDVVAPGAAVLSLRADSTDMYDDHEPNVHIYDDLYYIASGTSMSCPHVVGVAAYIRSVSAGLYPDLVQDIIEQSADDLIDPYGDGSLMTEWDKYSGHGRVSLYQALQITPNVFARIDLPLANKIVAGPIEIWGNAFRQGTLFTNYTIEVGQGKLPQEWTTVAEGSSWVEFDRLGSWETSGPSGYYTLRLKVGEENVHLRTFFVANESVAEINYPHHGDTISNFVSIYTTAYSLNYREMLLEYGVGENPDQFETLALVTRPVENELIFDWMVELLDEGIYTVRLTAFDDQGIAAQDEIELFLRSSFITDQVWKTDMESPLAFSANYGDFNNDGVQEIMLDTQDGIKFVDPEGRILDSGLPTFSENSYLAPPAVGRLDNDDLDDIVALGIDPSIISVYLSGGGGFEIPLEFDIDDATFTTVEHEFPKLFLYDLTGDGRDEIFLSGFLGLYFRSQVYDPDGNQLLDMDHISEIQPADLNGDNVYELYIYSEIDSHLKKIDLTGQVLDSVLLSIEDKDLQCTGLSVVDIDNDEIQDLVVFGYFSFMSYWLYVVDDNLNPKPGWPQNMGIDDYVVPSVPIFVDLDEDGTLEYMTDYFGLSYSYIHVWNLDGSSFLEGSPNGYWATIPRPGVLNMLTVADINGDDRLDIIACANDDLFFTYRAQRIYAWDYAGIMLEGYPFIITPNNPLIYYSNFRFTPVIGDLNEDGFFDLSIPGSDSSLVFLNFPNSEYRTCKVPGSMWRYNRSFSNIMDPVNCSPTDINDQMSGVLPDRFDLHQNYPNPFNPVTNIEYDLPERAHVTLTIYNLLGRKMTTLVDEEVAAGTYRVSWNGTDAKGTEAATGVYFYSIRAGEFQASKKMILLK